MVRMVFHLRRYPSENIVQRYTYTHSLHALCLVPDVWCCARCIALSTMISACWTRNEEDHVNLLTEMSPICNIAFADTLSAILLLLLEPAVYGLVKRSIVDTHEYVLSISANAGVLQNTLLR